jgi:hypothetical protein
MVAAVMLMAVMVALAAMVSLVAVMVALVTVVALVAVAVVAGVAMTMTVAVTMMATLPVVARMHRRPPAVAVVVATTSAATVVVAVDAVADHVAVDVGADRAGNPTQAAEGGAGAHRQPADGEHSGHHEGQDPASWRTGGAMRVGGAVHGLPFSPARGFPFPSANRTGGFRAGWPDGVERPASGQRWWP